MIFVAIDHLTNLVHQHLAPTTQIFRAKDTAEFIFDLAVYRPRHRRAVAERIPDPPRYCHLFVLG